MTGRSARLVNSRTKRKRKKENLISGSGYERVDGTPLPRASGKSTIQADGKNKKSLTNKNFMLYSKIRMATAKKVSRFLRDAASNGRLAFVKRPTAGSFLLLSFSLEEGCLIKAITA